MSMKFKETDNQVAPPDGYITFALRYENYKGEKKEMHIVSKTQTRAIMLADDKMMKLIRKGEVKSYSYQLKRVKNPLECKKPIPMKDAYTLPGVDETNKVPSIQPA